MSDSQSVHTIRVSGPDEGVRLDVFLAGSLDVSRSKARKLIDNGQVAASDGKSRKASYPVEEGETYTVTIPDEHEPAFVAEDINLDILYEDEHIIVINKPPGMVVHPGRGNITGTLAGGLLAHVQSIAGVGDHLRPGIVHRLDKDTSGVIVAALTERTHRKLSDMIARHEVSRSYIAWVWGRPAIADSTIDAPIGRHQRYGTLKAVREDGRHAVTHYETDAVFEFVSRLRVRLETGRTHQIRVHLAHIGHHVLGDPTYGGREERLGGFQPEIRTTARRLLADLDRQALHAAELRFAHPMDGRPLVFTAPLPPDLVRLDTALCRNMPGYGDSP